MKIELYSFHKFIFIPLFFIFASCDSSDLKEKDSSYSSKEEYSYTSKDYLNLKVSDYKKRITNELEKKDGCDYYVKGRIEFYKQNTILAVIDYGDGECDDIATKEVDGIVENINLSEKKESKDSKYKKIILNPLVKIENCNYIVDGTIEYYKGYDLVATINYGDGTCDNIATKTVDGEVYEYTIKEYSK